MFHGWRKIIGYIAVLYIAIWIGLEIWFMRPATLHQFLGSAKYLFHPSVYRFHGTVIGYCLEVLRILLFIVVPVALGVGIISAFRSRKLDLKWKILVGGLISTIVLEGFLITQINELLVDGGDQYSFDDFGTYIMAHGSWTSDAEQGALVQRTRIECFHDWNQCIETTAALLESEGGGHLGMRVGLLDRLRNKLLELLDLGYQNYGYLDLVTTLWKVQDWGADAIQLESQDAICTITTLNIDRKNKTVTSTRTTKEPKPNGCEGVSDQPFFFQLGDSRTAQL